MTWIEAVFLGILQGATEFLPVSSSGHLVIGQSLLGIELPGAGFETVLHAATLLSVAIVYRARIGALLAGIARGDRDQLRYAGLLLLASVPAAVAGIGFGGFLESLFDRPWIAGAGLLASGCVVWTARRALARGPAPARESPGPRGSADPRQPAAPGGPAGAPGAATALVIGLAQAAAIVPGISRSGTTVVAALWRGVGPAEAAAFSFLMSMVAVGGAALLKLPEVLGGGGPLTPGVLVAGGAAACATGVLAIRVFRAMLDNCSFHAFAPYLWAAGAAFLLYTGLS